VRLWRRHRVAALAQHCSALDPGTRSTEAPDARAIDLAHYGLPISFLGAQRAYHLGEKSLGSRLSIEIRMKIHVRSVELKPKRGGNRSRQANGVEWRRLLEVLRDRRIITRRHREPPHERFRILLPDVIDAAAMLGAVGATAVFLKRYGR